MQSTLVPTYEASINERPHPDDTVVRRLQEATLSDCAYGCKVYADPRSNYTVLVHSAIYGCRT
jgi:hypothetical protein